jgi:hypothetical protein
MVKELFQYPNSCSLVILLNKENHSFSNYKNYWIILPNFGFVIFLFHHLFSCCIRIQEWVSLLEQKKGLWKSALLLWNVVAMLKNVVFLGSNARAI